MVGCTITSTDDAISRYFEKYAPNVSDRFEALKQLNKNGIKTYAFVGPLLPHYVANSNELERIFEKLREVGTRDMFVEHLNLSPYIRNRLFTEMKDFDTEMLTKFYSSQLKSYRDELNEKLRELVKKYDMNLLTDRIIYHKEYQQNPANEHPFKELK